MFEILDVKRKMQPPTAVDLLDMFYGKSTILVKGENGKWYVIQDGNGADIVWDELHEDSAETEKMIIKSNMENVSKIVIIKGAAEVWCDNECGGQDKE